MNIIEITVGNKKYKISCNPGEENHILNLSKKLDQKYSQLSKNLGHKASESMIFVIMGLMILDENSTKNTSSPSKAHLVSICKKIESTISNLENLQNS